MKVDKSSFVAILVFYQSSSLITETEFGHLIRFTLGFTREREITASSVSMCTKKFLSVAFKL